MIKSQLELYAFKQALNIQNILQKTKIIIYKNDKTIIKYAAQNRQNILKFLTNVYYLNNVCQFQIV